VQGCRLLEQLRRASLRLCRRPHRLLAAPLRPAQLCTQQRPLVHRTLARLATRPAHPAEHGQRERAAASPAEQGRHRGMLRRSARVRGALRMRLEAARLQRVRCGAARCNGWAAMQSGAERVVRGGGARLLLEHLALAPLQLQLHA
jgi:hypothetical protein